MLTVLRTIVGFVIIVFIILPIVTCGAFLVGLISVIIDTLAVAGGILVGAFFMFSMDD